MTDLDAVRDDLALDTLAAGRLPDEPDDVLGLLHALRTDLDPAPNVVPLRPRRGRRVLLAALSAAAGLVIGGLTAGAVVSADQPDQLFYVAHKALLGDPGDADRVTRLLDDAAEALAKGDRRDALRRLDRADDALAGVEDPAERTALSERLDRLRVVLADVTPLPSATPSPDETPEPRETDRETEDPDDDSSGSGSGGDGGDDGDSSGSGFGGDDTDNSGSGSSNSGSGSSGKGSGDVLRTLDPDKSDGD